MKNTEFSYRLLQVIEFMQLKPASFAKHLGYTRTQSIYDFLNSKVNPSFDFFTRFVKSGFSDQINLTWLLTGDGEMLKTAGYDRSLYGYEPINDSQKIFERLLIFLEKHDFSKSDFSKGIRKDLSWITLGVKGEIGLFEEDFIKIMSQYPQLRIEWLLTGKGEMTEATTSAKTDAEILMLNHGQSIDTSQHSKEQGIEVMKKYGHTEFFGLQNGQFLAISPLVDETAYKRYYSDYFDDEYISELPRHAMVLNTLYVGEYRSFEIPKNSVAGAGEFELRPGMIATGRRYEKKISGRRMEFIKGTQCVIVLKDRTIFTEITEVHDEDRSRIGISCPDPTVPKKKLILYSEDIREIYQIEYTSQISGKSFE